MPSATAGLAGKEAATEAGGQEWRIPVHACLLAAHSDYFRSLLLHGWRDSADVDEATGLRRLHVSADAVGSQHVMLVLLHAMYVG